MYYFELVENNKVIRKNKKDIKYFNLNEVKYQLPLKWHFNKLIKENVVRVHNINSANVSKALKEKDSKKEKQKLEQEFKKAQRIRRREEKVKEKDEQLLLQRNLYKYELNHRKNIYEVYRKNIKGFYNFIDYATDPLNVEDVITNDINKKILEEQEKVD